MKKVCDKKGFTLAELLIVMAIILILAAIAIPNFTDQLERARETADINAIRAAYSEAMTEHMLNKDDNVGPITVKITQAKTGWKNTQAIDDLPFTCSYATTSDGAPGNVDLYFHFNDAAATVKAQCTVNTTSGSGGGATP